MRACIYVVGVYVRACMHAFMYVCASLRVSVHALADALQVAGPPPLWNTGLGA